MNKSLLTFGDMYVPVCAKFNPIMQEHRDSRNGTDSAILLIDFLLFICFFIGAF